MLETNKIYHGDCLEIMKLIDSESINMILTDLPYGSSKCSWDTVIPFESLWEQYKIIAKQNAAILLFGKEPFSSYLRLSNIKMYKYEWIWEKQQGTNPTMAKMRPLNKIENISVFYLDQPVYNPQMTQGAPYTGFSDKSKRCGIAAGGARSKHRDNPTGERYPTNILRFNTERSGFHPTQKPVDLCEYLIRTYTNPGDLVLDSCIGSGTTAVACLNTGRRFIGIEKEMKYVEIANKRIETCNTENISTETKDSSQKTPSAREGSENLTSTTGVLSETEEEYVW